MVQSDKKAITGIVVLILVFFVVFWIFATFTLNSIRSQVDDDSWGSSASSSKSSIGVVEIIGPIFESKSVVEKLLMAEEDQKIKAIILRIDSPGGAVGPTQEIYEEIRRIDAEKPVYASFGSIAASGGYYLGAATRRIYASAGTLTGSIGVIMNFMNLKDVYKFLRVKPEIIKSGRYKDVGSPHRDMTNKERGMMTGMIAKVHDQFRRDILATRKDKIKGNLIEHTQGQIFSGEEAKEIGLVDELAGLWAAGRLIHKELDLKGKFGLRYIKKPKKFSFTDLLSDLEESMAFIKAPFYNRMPMYMFEAGE